MTPQRLIEILAEVSHIPKEDLSSDTVMTVLFNLFKMKPEKKLKLSIEALDNFGVYPEIIKDMLNDLNKLVAEKKSLKEELESERIKHAACGVIAMCNTLESLTKNREMKAEYLSASVQDVINLQQQNIKNLSGLARLRQCEAIVRELAKNDNWLNRNEDAIQWVRENPE